MCSCVTYAVVELGGKKNKDGLWSPLKKISVPSIRVGR